MPIIVSQWRTQISVQKPNYYVQYNKEKFSIVA